MIKTEIKKGFTNINGIYYPEVRKIAYSKEDLYGNLGILVNQSSKEANDFYDPNDIDRLDGVYIYQTYHNPNVAYRIYREFADYKFNGYQDDRLINALQEKQDKIKLTEFPSGVVTVNGYIIGQEIPYYPNYQTLLEFIKNNPNKEKLLKIYKRIIMIQKELYDNGIIYTDVYGKNYMVNKDLDIKLIDFEANRTIINDMNKYYINASFNSLKNMINTLNELMKIDYYFKETLDYDNALEQIDIMKKVLK